MAYLTDEELLAYDVDSGLKKEPVPDDLAEILLLLDVDHSQDPPRPDPIPPYARELRDQEWEEPEPKKRKEPKPPKAPKPKKVRTPEEKRVLWLSILAGVETAVAAGLGVCMILWMR